MAALYGELLTAAREKVKPGKSPYASAIDTAQAVVDGEIGIVPAYESTVLRAMPGGQTMPGDMEATLSMALPPGIVALPAAAAQRGTVLAVSKATSKRYKLHSLADLRTAGSRLTLGGSASGDPAAPRISSLKKAYGVTLTSAGTGKSADVLVLRSTDPTIARDGLVVLTGAHFIGQRRRDPGESRQDLAAFQGAAALNPTPDPTHTRSKKWW